MADRMFEGATALVTGAAGGLGQATALAFARQGARVACADRTPEACEETVGLIGQIGGEALALGGDVAEPETAREWVARTVEQFGGLQHAFNNAGVRGCTDDPWDEVGIARTLAINLEGVIWGVKQQIAHMVENGGGTIVNTASIAGISGAVGLMDYTAAKHGVVGFSKAAALRYGAQGVRINGVCPGVIDTPMTRAAPEQAAIAEAAIKRLSPILGRLGEEDDIAEAVIWLSSRKSKFVYGVALPVDGGFSI